MLEPKTFRELALALCLLVYAADGRYFYGFSAWCERRIHRVCPNFGLALRVE
jgi:hypothetical protein